MARFAFRLESVLTYRRGLRDQVQQLLAKLLRDDDELVRKSESAVARRQEQQAELHDLQLEKKLPVDRTAWRRYHAGLLSIETQTIAQQRELLAGHIQKCRELLSRTERDVKLLEKLREKQLAEHLQAEERRAAREREEAWIGAHWTEFAE